MFAVLIIISAFCAGAAVFVLIALLGGNKPLARAMRVIGAIVAGGGYFVLLISIWYGDSQNTSDALGLGLLFAPIVVFGIIKLIAYAKGGRNDQQ